MVLFTRLELFVIPGVSAKFQTYVRNIWFALDHEARTSCAFAGAKQGRQPTPERVWLGSHPSSPRRIDVSYKFLCPEGGETN